jgi:ligand-binding sensor domain-containing protein
MITRMIKVTTRAIRAKCKIFPIGLGIVLFFYGTLFSYDKKIQFEHLKTTQGLPQSAVICICQDSIGFIWFGTYNGAFRYDGYSSKRFNYDANDTNSINNNSVQDIIVDKDGILWFATEDGICKFNYQNEKFTRYKKNPKDTNSLNYNNVRSLLEDKEDHLWIGTYGGGLDCFDRKNNIFKHFKRNSENISDNKVYQIYEDRHNNLWLATDGGLILFNRENNTFKPYVHDPGDSFSISHNNVMRIYEDSKGDLWVGTWGYGLNRLKKGYNNNLNSKLCFYHYSHYDNKHSAGLSNDIIYDILEDRFGNLFFATSGGGINILLDRENGQFLKYRKDYNDPQSLSNNKVSSLFEDKTGVLWVGSYGGIDKFDPFRKKFELYSAKPFDPNTYVFNGINSLLVDSNSKGDIVWLGNQSDGISRYELNKGYKKGIKRYLPMLKNPLKLPNGTITAICRDKSERLWIGTGAGLSRLENEQKEIFCNYSPNSEKNSLSNQDVFSLLVDRKNILWIGTYEGGINCLDLNNSENLNPGKAKFTHFFHDTTNSSSLSDMTIWNIFEDNEGILWIGTEKGGLNRFDRISNKFDHFLFNPADTTTLSDNHVQCIFEDRDGNLWIGTSNGLNELKNSEKKICHNPRFIRYRKKDRNEREGLPSNSVNAIQQDKKGNLWVSTDKGISQINPITGNCNNYNSEDGLQGEEFANNVSAIGLHGIMYFGGNNGLNIFNPDSIKCNPNKPSVVLTDFRISNDTIHIGEKKHGRIVLSQSISKTKRIELSYKDNVVSFEFAGLMYGSPEFQQYAYCMKGFEKNWNFVGNYRYAHYILPPGEYEFHVIASNSDGLWNEKGAQIKIKIWPPWWETSFYKYVILIFIVIAGFLSLYFFFRSRKARNSLREIELQRVRDQKLRQAELEYINNKLEIISNDSIKLISNDTEIKLSSEALSLIHKNFSTYAALYKFGDKNDKSKLGMINCYPPEFSKILNDIWNITNNKMPYKEELSNYCTSYEIAVNDSEKEEIGYLVIYREGDEIKRAEEFIEYDKHCLHLLANAIGYSIQKLTSIQEIESFLNIYDSIFNIMMSLKNEKEIWDDIALKICTEIEYEGCSIFLSEGSNLCLKGTTGIIGNPKYSDVKYGFGEGLTGEAFIASETVIYFNELNRLYNTHISKYNEILASGKSTSLLFVKIQDKDNIPIGIIRCNTKKGAIGIHSGQFLEPNIKKLLIICKLIANIRLKVIDINNFKKEWERNINALHHELLSPVEGILQHIEWINKKMIISHLVNRDKINIKISDMYQSCKLIDMLLSSMGHLEVESLALNIALVSIPSLLQTCKSYLLNEANRYSIEIQIDHLGLPKIQADALHLMRVFYNLMRNSIKYHDVKEKKRYIKIFSKEDSKNVFIVFEDNGIGIDKNEIKIIFSNSVRGTNARLLFPEGTGLGLAYCKNIIEAHSGEIYVDNNNYCKPTKIIIKLPQNTETI